MDRSEFWGFVGAIAIIAAAVVALVFLTMVGVSQYNRHNAPLSFAQCAQMCGPVGVHSATPDYKCECNETKRIEGHPSIDLNLRQGNQ